MTTNAGTVTSHCDSNKIPIESKRAVSKYIFHAETRTEIREEDIGAPGPGELSVRTSKTLVSVGTEMAFLRGTGNIPRRVGRSGYSNAGRVIGIGEGVQGFSIGDRVFIGGNHCTQFNWSSTVKVYRIPDNVTDLQASFAQLASIAQHIVQRAKIPLGGTAIVVGQGTVGLLTAKFARLAGAGRVIGVDMSEERRKQSLKFGADIAIAPDKDRFAEAMASCLPHRHPPLFLEATGSARALEWCVENALLHSRVIVSGTFTETIRIDPLKSFILNEIEIVGAHHPKCPDEPVAYFPYSKRANVEYFFSCVGKGLLDADALCDAILKPEDAASFFNDASAGTATIRQPVIDWE